MADSKSVVPVRDTLTKFCKFVETIKGRDKITKVVQYSSRAVKHYLLAADPKSDWGQRFDGLYSTTGTGRKLFRIGKSLNEYETLRGLISKGPDGDPIKYYLSVVKQLSFISYWFFDNIGFGIRAKFLKYDKKSTGLYGSYGWTIGSVCGLLIALYEYQKSTAKVAKKIKAYKEAKAAGKDIAEMKKELLALGFKRQKSAEDVVRYWFDVIVSASSAELPQAVGLTAPHDGVIGILGAASALINTYQIWRDDK